MDFANVAEIRKACRGILTIRKNGRVTVRNESRLKMELVERLARGAAFGKSAGVRDTCRFLIRAAGLNLGIFSASIQELYLARARGELAPDFTVPAVNIRMMTFYTARALFRAAKQTKSVFLAEIARSEIGYTHQRPAEYASSILAAAIREGWRGPVFIQGDHFQANAKAFKKDPRKVVSDIKALCREAVDAGFYNIDIDTSTLVDLSKKTVRGQQRLNFEVGADLMRCVRSREPAGVTISLGGEIGEVGGKNSTVEEFEVYMKGLLKDLGKGRKPLAGPSKISVQTGTAHGGVVRPDGTVADVKIDFDVLRDIGKACRTPDYVMGGTVQHGASTLPDDAFHHFPKSECTEVHLATGFQNLVYEHERFPADLKERIYDWLRTNCAGERKKGQTEEQFLYKTRKKGFGPFKAECWGLPTARRKAIMKDLQKSFVFLMGQLNVGGLRKTVEGLVTRVDVHPKMPKALAKDLQA
ncbi:MAG: class II fructose-bisphosphate aldolase [Planctomycetota bacterium]|jgi:fructose/tagatose bisphosphate aldolase